MNIKTSFEIWDDVPIKDMEDIAHTKRWVSVESEIAFLKELLTDKLWLNHAPTYKLIETRIKELTSNEVETSKAVSEGTDK